VDEVTLQGMLLDFLAGFLQRFFRPRSDGDVGAHRCQLAGKCQTDAR
jgi:hypothetical protein